MKPRSREPVPPFAVVAGRPYAIANWDAEAEDVPAGSWLQLRPLNREEAAIYRGLVRDALVEAFARTQGRNR